MMRPGPGDIAPYFQGYVERVPDGEIIQILQQQIETTCDLMDEIGESRGEHRYAPGKWSIKEVLGHLIDCERVFAYRALRFARGDTTELPGFDENAYATQGSFDRRSLGELTAEYELVRRSDIALFGSLSPEAVERKGSANGMAMSVAAIPWVVAGHELHHLAVIRERYVG